MNVHDQIKTTTSVLERLAKSSLGERLTANERHAVLVLEAAAWDDELVSMSTLAGRVGMSKAALTSLADRLDVLGLVQRDRWPNDRRRVAVALTEAGRGLVSTALETRVGAEA